MFSSPLFIFSKSVEIRGLFILLLKAEMFTIDANAV